MCSASWLNKKIGSPSCIAYVTYEPYGYPADFVDIVHKVAIFVFIARVRAYSACDGFATFRSYNSSGFEDPSASGDACFVNFLCPLSLLICLTFCIFYILCDCVLWFFYFIFDEDSNWFEDRGW